MKFIENFSLDNRSVLITGAGGMLGFYHSYAVLELGAHVVLTDIEKDKLENARLKLSEKFNPDSIDCIEMDVTNEDAVMSVKNELLRSKKNISILINNAAIDSKFDLENQNFSRVENFDLSQWQLELNVGLMGAFICSKVFGTEMAKNRHGNIINIASDLSVISPDQRLYMKDDALPEDQPVKPITYSVIKSGLLGLTRYLSTYWSSSGVRSNCLSPGGVYNDHDQIFVQKLSDLIPLGRMADIDEYVGAIQFLASDASSYMNGQNLVIDGGRSVL